MIDYANQPNCESCGRPMTPVGKLPPIAGRPVIHVFKCSRCRQIVSRKLPGQERDCHADGGPLT
jgi:hypothetical protein